MQWDCVQDFLSNVATFWLWVGTSQFDIDAHETWIFATSSQGMLPLASQYNRSSHLRMKQCRIKFHPNLCTLFAKCVAPFVCRDSRKLFALWSDTISPASAAVVKPFRLPVDKITSWAPTVLYMWSGGTIHQMTFPPSPNGNSFKMAVFGRTQAIKHYRNALAQDPLKRALLPTLAGKALVCHCLAHEECHADVLVQTYESEVMACAKFSCPVTPNASPWHRRVSRGPQMVEVFTALEVGSHRRRASAMYLKTSGTPLSRSSPSTGSTTQPRQHGRYKAAHLSCRTTTMTKPGKRRDPFFKQQVSVRTCPLFPDSRFTLGSSATCCGSCTTPTLAQSTSLSQASTRASSNQYQPLSFLVDTSWNTASINVPLRPDHPSERQGYTAKTFRPSAQLSHAWAIVPSWPSTLRNRPSNSCHHTREVITSGHHIPSRRAIAAFLFISIGVRILQVALECAHARIFLSAWF